MFVQGWSIVKRSLIDSVIQSLNDSDKEIVIVAIDGYM